MKIFDLFEARPNDFLSKEISASGSKIDYPGAREPEAPGPGLEDDLGVTDIGQLGPLGADPEAAPGAGPGPGAPEPDQMPEGPTAEPEIDAPIVPEPPSPYGDWSEMDSVDRRDRTFTHDLTGFNLRIRSLNIHPNRYLAQIYKGRKMIHAGKVDMPDGVEDPVQYIINIADKALNLEREEAPPAPPAPPAPEDPPAPL